MIHEALLILVTGSQVIAVFVTPRLYPLFIKSHSNILQRFCISLCGVSHQGGGWYGWAICLKEILISLDWLTCLHSALLKGEKNCDCGEKFIDNLHLEYFQSFIILIQKDRNRLLSSLTRSSKTELMVPSPLSSPHFLESRLCYLSSSLASRLSAGFLFHIRPSFTGPSTLQPYDITCGPKSDLLFSHTLFLVLLLHCTPPPSFFCKKKRSLMAFPERVGGMCVEYVPLWELYSRAKACALSILHP